MRNSVECALALLAAIAAIVFAPHAGATVATSGTNRLEAMLVFDQKSGNYVIVLENRSDEYLCVNAESFDTKKARVRLFDRSGRDVRRSSYADGPETFDLGFDYQAAYFILAPATKRLIDIDFGNFDAPRGEYRYLLTFEYYECRTAIDKARVRARRVAVAYPIRLTGVVSVPRPEKSTK